MVTIAAIIPTRNRARYAMSAARSLLDQDSRIDIYLCDNSSSPGLLAEFCQEERRVTYLRPASELPMAENWDWAVRQAMERSAATHFTIHYDRKHSKAGSWDRLSALASIRPDQLISFPVDQITSQPPPLRLWQTPWTGKAYSITTVRLAEMIASGRLANCGQALPIFSNCLIPRAVLRSIVDRFGDVCKSTGPDSAFLARFLALHDSYTHHDRAQGVLLAPDRSIGMSYLRGKGKDFPDFLGMIGDRPWLDAAPVPGISLGNNLLYHEYELVRRATADRLPPFDRDAILRDLASDLRWTADPGVRRKLAAALAENGWNGPEPEPLPKRIRGDMLNERKIRRRMEKEGYLPPTITGFMFRNDEEGLRYALRHPRIRQETPEHLEPLQAVEIDA